MKKKFTEIVNNGNSLKGLEVVMGLLFITKVIEAKPIHT